MQPGTPMDAAETLRENQKKQVAPLWGNLLFKTLL
jgi:hypothetical protein